MNRNFLREYKKILVFLTFSFSLILQMQPSDSTDVAITVVGENSSKVIMIKFSEEELEKIKENPSLLMKKLKSKGVSCCEKRERISDCIWRCCDKKLINICSSKILVKAFTKVLPALKTIHTTHKKKTAVYKDPDKK